MARSSEGSLSSIKARGISISTSSPSIRPTNNGFGTQAMGFIERTFPATVWTLDTPTFATRKQHFYEKLAFVRVGETVFPDITLIQYEKRLS